jgi:hypothetical protein
MRRGVIGDTSSSAPRPASASLTALVMAVGGDGSALAQALLAETGIGRGRLHVDDAHVGHLARARQQAGRSDGARMGSVHASRSITSSAAHDERLVVRPVEATETDCWLRTGTRRLTLLCCGLQRVVRAHVRVAVG